MTALTVNGGEPVSLHTPADAAKRMGFSESWIYGLVRQGHLPAYRLGGALLIRAEDILAALKPATYPIRPAGEGQAEVIEPMLERHASNRHAEFRRISEI
jgi:excisionase family DNA binding protein